MHGQQNIKKHMKVVRLSALGTGRLNPQEVVLVLISFRVWVDPSVIMRPEELCQWKIKMTPTGIAPATFHLVAHCLNQLRKIIPCIIQLFRNDMNPHFHRICTPWSLECSWKSSHDEKCYYPAGCCWSPTFQLRGGEWVGATTPPHVFAWKIHAWSYLYLYYPEINFNSVGRDRNTDWYLSTASTETLCSVASAKYLCILTAFCTGCGRKNSRRPSAKRMRNARCVATSDPQFFINSSTIKTRCSSNHAMVYIKNGTYSAIWRRSLHHCMCFSPEAMPLPNWGVLSAAPCNKIWCSVHSVLLCGVKARRIASDRRIVVQTVLSSAFLSHLFYYHLLKTEIKTGTCFF